MRIDSYEVKEGRVVAVYISDKRRNMKQFRYEQARPRGEWIKKYNADDPTTACSVCGFDTEDKVYFNFCPNCGTPMTEKALEILRKREGDAE